MPTIDIGKISKEVSEKYKVVNNSFRLVVKPDPKDLVVVEVGDTKQPDTFYPQVKICRWGDTENDNEVNVSFRLKDDQSATETVTTDKDKIIWSKGTKEAHFYDIAPCEEHPEGAMEFEIILKSKPATNRIEFSLQTKGLDFFYQPSLTQQEIDQGASRPENVVGSYAVYHSTKGGMNDAAGMEYKVGKFGHIYRPKVTDANGSETWGELNIDEAKGELLVTIPQDFLDKAVYPIRHAAGLTFGYTTAGATWSSAYNQLRGTVYTSPVDAATAVSMTLWYKNGSATRYAKLLLVLASNLNIISNGITPPINCTDAGPAEGTGTFATPPTLSASTNYVLMFIENGGTLACYLDTTGGSSRLDSSNNYTTPTNPTDATSGTFKYSIYCTYTAAGGEAARPSYLNLLGVG